MLTKVCSMLVKVCSRRKNKQQSIFFKFDLSEGLTINSLPIFLYSFMYSFSRHIVIPSIFQVLFWTLEIERWMRMFPLGTSQLISNHNKWAMHHKGSK